MRVRILIINANEEVKVRGLDKIVINVDSERIRSYFDFKNFIEENINEEVERITDEKGFTILENTNDIWNVIKENEVTIVRIFDKKNAKRISSTQNKSDFINNEKKLDSNLQKKNYQSYSFDASNRRKKTFDSDSNRTSESSSIYFGKKNTRSKLSHKAIIQVSSDTSDNSEKSSESKKIKKYKQKKPIKNKKIQENKDSKLIKNNQFLSKKRNQNEEKDESIKVNVIKEKKIIEHKKVKERKFSKEFPELLISSAEKKFKISLPTSHLAQIPSEKIEDIDYLKNNFPSLFTPGSIIIFKIPELSDEGISQSEYKIGKILQYIEENDNSFFIELSKIEKENLSSRMNLLMFGNDSEESDSICVFLKNFICLWIFNAEAVNKENDITIIKNSVNDNIHHFIKRQLEYYFSQKNYENDSYLKQCEDENGCKFLNI